MAHKRNEFLKEIRGLSEEELQQKLNELRSELIRLRTQVVMGTIKDTMAIRNIRKNIARILTVLNEKRRARKA
ncbi:MAG: 50S ribosomal protein L29 [Sulfolobales archaeon]|nr:50S ribosomal protein L29 [Sulfolobales archaeon]MCG2893588.1 50S ribosomal protein L29 [Sulfolobales archaeon]MCG2910861.1 50S ribosomal protein L29 [Sulfolobales archaeon]MCQ4343639.1 50S ribosomal protein L29 [Sulfolobales archaeon]